MRSGCAAVPQVRKACFLAEQDSGAGVALAAGDHVAPMVRVALVLNGEPSRRAAAERAGGKSFVVVHAATSALGVLAGVSRSWV